MTRHSPDSYGEVTDARLRERVEAEVLRFADTSIRPETMSGDTIAPSVMIGAIVADLVSAGRSLPLGE